MTNETEPTRVARHATALLAAFAVAAAAVSPAAAACQTGAASAPYIGAADMRAIDRAVVRLPAERPGRVHLSVGAPVPRGIARKPLPATVAKVLPQYKGGGYTAFRVGERLAIVNRRDVLSYILPLGHPAGPGNCP